MNNDLSLFIAKGFKRVPAIAPVARTFNNRRHRRILRQIEALCVHAAKVCEHIETSANPNNGPIWVFWWQGLKTAPALVKACIRSIEQHSGSRDVIVITEQNIRKYAKLPEYIYTKVERKEITLTQLSDILRFNLLHNHGGLWMDATLYVTGNLDTPRYFGPFFTCSGFSDPTYFFVTKGLWTGFFIGGCKKEPLFSYMDYFFQLYWEKNSRLIDYFLIDYALRYAYEKGIGSLRKWVLSERSKDNPELFDLAPIIAQPYNPAIWQTLKSKTGVFKLSWKKPKNYPEGSYGAYLLSGKL